MQPLISHLGSNQNGYFVISNGNYLQIYDQNKNLVNEILTGPISGQLDLVDFDNDGKVNDITGMYPINTTDMSFRAYTFNPNTAALTLYLQTNISLATQGTSVNSSGVRCEDLESGAVCNAVVWSYNGTKYLNNIFRFLPNGGVTNAYLTFSYTPMAEPLAWVDADNDNVVEYLTYSYDKIILFTTTGTIERTFTSGFAGGTAMNDGWRGARFAKVDGTPQWRIATALKTTSTCGVGNYNCAYVTVYKLDGSTLWSNALSAVNSGDFMDLSNLAIGDYDLDGKDDIYVTEKRTVNNLYAKFRTFKGSDGTSLLNKQVTGVSTLRGDNSHMMLARMDADNSMDIIGVGGGTVTVYSPSLDAYLLQGFGNGCGIGDLTYDSTTEMVCSTTSTTYVYQTNFTNNNAVLLQLAFSPGLSVPINTPLSIVFNASDSEFNSIFYSALCGNGINTTEDLSNVKTCTYSQAGSYIFQGRVRDGYHAEYSMANVTITVTQSGAVCNANLVCEAEIGESYSNCPSDCAAPTGNNTIGGGDGQLSLPIHVVNPDNEEEGLLPTIYYGLLSFFSYALLPIAGIVFTLLLALTVIAIFGIVRNISRKIFQ
jgi:hypothetical protein